MFDVQRSTLSGFSIPGVSRFKTGKPLEADLALEGMESATLVLHDKPAKKERHQAPPLLLVAPRAPSTLNLHFSTI
jgi:hypothetical protein